MQRPKNCKGNEAKVIALFRSGDEDTLTMLVGTHLPDLIAACSYFVLPPENEELANDAVSKLWEKRRAMESETCPKFLSWAIRTAKRVCIDHVRREKRHAAKLEDYSIGLQKAFETTPVSESDLEGLGSNPRLTKAVAQLPPAKERILEYVYIKGMPLDVAANQMGITYDSAKSLSYKARQSLRVALGDGYL